MKKLIVTAALTISLAACAATTPHIVKAGNAATTAIFEQIEMGVMKVLVRQAIRKYSGSWLGGENLEINSKVASSFVRREVFSKLLGGEEVMRQMVDDSQVEYLMFRTATMEIAREYLRDPQRLLNIYTSLKPVIVEGLAAAPHDLGPRVARFLNKVVLPYLENPPDPEVIELMEKAQLAVENWEHPEKDESVHEEMQDNLYDEMLRTRDALRRSTKDVEILEWVERRRGEGGDALVEAWAQVLRDIVRSSHTYHPTGRREATWP